MFKRLSIRLTIYTLSLPLVGLVSSLPAYAEVCQKTGVGIGDKTKFCGTTGQGLLRDYINTLFSWGTGLISALAVLVIIFAGYRYMTSQGNPAKIESAKNMLTGAISGVLLIIFAYVILHAINPSLGG